MACVWPALGLRLACGWPACGLRLAWRVPLYLVVLVGQHIQQEADHVLRKLVFESPEYEFFQQRVVRQSRRERRQVAVPTITQYILLPA